MERAKAKISTLPSNELQRTLNSQLQNVHDDIRRAWQSAIERLVHSPTPSASSRPVYVQANIQEQSGRTRRLQKELADVEFRIAQGLDRCDQFFDEQHLLECRHSRSKLLFLDRGDHKAPLDFYSRALKGNSDVIHIRLICHSAQEYARFAETLCDLPPSVTSIWVWNCRRLPPIPCDTPRFIHDYIDSQSLETFLNNEQSLAHTRDTYVFMARKHPEIDIAVSFVGPSSGNLVLKLKHRATHPDMMLTVLGTSFTLTVPKSLTTDEINLRPDGNSPSQLSFIPNTRNNLILQASLLDYILQDLLLLDENGKPYRQSSQRNIPATEFDALSMPYDCESS
jgi:hypothetical protein